jgi:transposase
MQPLLPATGRPGSLWVEHRQVLSGMLWQPANRVPGAGLPGRDGPWQYCDERLRR